MCTTVSHPKLPPVAAVLDERYLILLDEMLCWVARAAMPTSQERAEVGGGWGGGKEGVGGVGSDVCDEREVKGEDGGWMPGADVEYGVGKSAFDGLPGGLGGNGGMRG